LRFFRFLEDPISLLYFIPVFLITIVVHEVSHAYAAYKLGDRTAAAMGRLTLNPLRHIDPFGLIMLLIVGFGWAKPVPINPRNFKNEKSGMAISALAGPVSNILMAFAGLIIFKIIVLIGKNADIILLRGHDISVVTGAAGSVMIAALTFFSRFYTMNIWFAVFNLLPIPPLDGSRIVNYFLPPRWSYYYSFLERYGFIILMALLWTGILWVPLGFFGGLIEGAMNFILDPVFNLFM